jgi:predicted nucleotidyltransferase
MVQKTILNEKTIKAIGSYQKDLINAGVHVDKLIVFGSQISGSAKSWSDIDLCVVSNKFSHDLHSEMVRLLQIRSDASLDIEPHPMRPEDLEDRYDVLAVEIRKYGIVI